MPLTEPDPDRLASSPRCPLRDRVCVWICDYADHEINRSLRQLLACFRIELRQQPLQQPIVFNLKLREQSHRREGCTTVYDSGTVVFDLSPN